MKHLAVCVAAACAILGIQDVAAGTGDYYGGDAKTMSGAQCQPSWGNQWADFVVNPDGIRNISDQNRYISCTVTIDSENQIDQADSGSSTEGGGLTMFLGFDYSQVPATGSYTTTCTLIKTGLHSSASAALSVTSARTTNLVYSYSAADAFNGLWVSNLETFSFNCRLPPKVKLKSVYWREDGTTDRYDYSPPAP